MACNTLRVQFLTSRVARGALLACVVAACDSENDQRHLDASVADGESPDAPPDAPPDASCERTLLVGGTDVTAQGWTIVTSGPATVSYGADYVELQTSTNTTASTGGHLLLSYPGAVTAGTAFKLEVEILLQSMTPHNQFDAPAAIMGAFTLPFGIPAERAEMIYLDAAALGWADDTQSYAAAISNGSYHTYVLSVDAANNATVTIDGTAALTRSPFTSNGTIAIGDQTNEPNVDGTMRIRSVRLLCP